MSNKKPGQHYVWRYYLTSWAPLNKIWTLINSQILTNQCTENVGKKRYIYKINPPTKDENEFAKKIYGIDKMSDEFRRVVEGWIKPFELLYFANDLKKQGLIESLKDIETIDEMLANAEENLHSEIESGAVKYFADMKMGNFSFLSNEDSRAKFCFFAALQYFRTLRNKNAMLESINNTSIRQALEKTWNYGKFIFSTQIGLYLNRTTITIYHNKTLIPLITSDQPVINLDAKFKSDGTPPEEMTLYYPITPKLALVFSKGDKTVIEKDLDEYFKVEEYNDLMHNWSENHTFASEEILLKKYISESD